MNGVAAGDAVYLPGDSCIRGAENGGLKLFGSANGNRGSTGRNADRNRCRWRRISSSRAGSAAASLK